MERVPPITPDSQLLSWKTSPAFSFKARVSQAMYIPRLPLPSHTIALHYLPDILPELFPELSHFLAALQSWLLSEESAQLPFSAAVIFCHAILFFSYNTCHTYQVHCIKRPDMEKYFRFPKYFLFCSARNWITEFPFGWKTLLF